MTDWSYLFVEDEDWPEWNEFTIQVFCVVPPPSLFRYFLKMSIAKSFTLFLKQWWIIWVKISEGIGKTYRHYTKYLYKSISWTQSNFMNSTKSISWSWTQSNSSMAQPQRDLIRTMAKPMVNRDRSRATFFATFCYFC